MRDLGHLQFEELCWNWNYCRFTWQVLNSLRYHTSHQVGGLFGGTLVVRFDIGSLWGLYKMFKTPACHDCLVVNGTSKLIINISSHGTAARVLTSGHPPETTIRVLTYGHSPGPLKQVLIPSPWEQHI